MSSFFATSSWNNVWGELTAGNRTIGSNNLFPGLLVPLAVAGGFTIDEHLVLITDTEVFGFRKRRRPTRSRR